MAVGRRPTASVSRPKKIHPQKPSPPAVRIIVLTCSGVQPNVSMARYDAKENAVANAAVAPSASVTRTRKRPRSPGTSTRRSPPLRRSASLSCDQRRVSGSERRR